MVVRFLSQVGGVGARKATETKATWQTTTETVSHIQVPQISCHSSRVKGAAPSVDDRVAGDGSGDDPAGV